MGAGWRTGRGKSHFHVAPGFPLGPGCNNPCWKNQPTRPNKTSICCVLVLVYAGLQGCCRDDKLRLLLDELLAFILLFVGEWDLLFAVSVWQNQQSADSDWISVVQHSKLLDHTHSWQDELEPGACSVAAGVPTCSHIYYERHFPWDLRHKHQNPDPEKVLSTQIKFMAPSQSPGCSLQSSCR